MARMIVLLFAIMASAVVNASAALAAVASGRIEEPMQMVPVNYAPNEMLGMVVCKPSGDDANVKCVELINFAAKEWTFTEYVRYKTKNKATRIVGLQYSPRENQIYLFIAIPEGEPQ